MSIEWPLASVNISQGYGPGHHGIDLAAPAGTPIYATDAGVVEANGWGQNHSWMLSPAGIFVLLRHSWGYSGYAHMTNYVVNVGQQVARGQLIGYVGATGAATGPHVHFEIFPPSPNWSNGYSGRISPYTYSIVPHSSTSTPPVTPPESKEEEMALPRLYINTATGVVCAASVATGFYWHVPAEPYIGLVRTRKLVVDDAPVRLNSDEWGLLQTLLTVARTTTNVK